MDTEYQVEEENPTPVIKCVLDSIPPNLFQSLGRGYTLQYFKMLDGMFELTFAALPPQTIVVLHLDEDDLATPPD